MADVDEKQRAIIVEAVAEAFKLYERGHPIKSPPILAISDEDARRLVREELERAIDKRMIELRTEAQILKLIDGRTERIGLRSDDEHYEATGNDMREVRTWAKRIRRLVNGLIFAFLSAAVVALAKLIGINLPSIEPR